MTPTAVEASASAVKIKLQVCTSETQTEPVVSSQPSSAATTTPPYTSSHSLPDLPKTPNAIPSVNSKSRQRKAKEADEPMLIIFYKSSHNVVQAAPTMGEGP